MYFACASKVNPSLEDRLAISELVAEYAYRWDSKDAAAFSKLFAADASMDWVIAGQVEEQRAIGREAIFSYAQASFRERQRQS